MRQKNEGEKAQSPLLENHIKKFNQNEFKVFPSGTSFDEDCKSGIIYRDDRKPYVDINYIGGYKDKKVMSIGKLIDVVYRELDENNLPKYKHQILKSEEMSKVSAKI